MSRAGTEGVGATYVPHRRHRGGATADRSAGGEATTERVWVDEDFADVGDEPAAEVTARLSIGLPNLPHIGAAVRRRWRLWCALGIIGLLMGAAVYHVRPPAYKASTALLIGQGSGSVAADQMSTDMALLQSDTVAAGAMRRLGLPVTAQSLSAFVSAYASVAITDQVLEIVVKASSSGQAVSWAKAIAADFLQVRETELESAEHSTLAALDQEISGERQQVAAIGTQINALSAERTSPAHHARIIGLQAERTQSKATLTGLEQAVALYQSTTQVSTQQQIRGSSVLDPAAPLPRSHLKEPTLYVGGGLAGGLALGLGFVIVQALVSVRLRRRDDVAYALGAPVRLSVGRVPAARWLPGRRGLRAARSREVQRIAGYLRNAVPVRPPASRSAGPAALAVVEVDSAPVAALSLVALAAATARDGQRVIVADLATGAPAARLLGVGKPGVRMVGEHGAELVVVVPDRADIGPAGPAPPPSAAAGPRPASTELIAASKSADLLLTLVTLDPSHGADHLPTWATDAVIVVTAGRSSATKIHATAEMIRLADTNLISSVLVGADKTDESLGITSAGNVSGGHEGEASAQRQDFHTDFGVEADASQPASVNNPIDRAQRVLLDREEPVTRETVPGAVEAFRTRLDLS